MKLEEFSSNNMGILPTLKGQIKHYSAILQWLLQLIDLCILSSTDCPVQQIHYHTPITNFIRGHSKTTWSEFWKVFTPMDSLYTLRVDKNRYFLTPSPSSCPRSYWMPPNYMTHALEMQWIRVCLQIQQYNNIIR